MSILLYLWSLPYLRWHIIFTFIPSILLWIFFGKYFLTYKKTFLYVTIGSFLWGLPFDILATPVWHIYMYPGKNLGFMWHQIPLEEFFFLLFVPQEMTCVALLVRKVLYGKF